MLVALGLILAGSLAVGGRWLWRQRWREASARRKVVIVSVGSACILLIPFLIGGAQLLWHERPNQAVTAEDLRILDRADAFLKDESAWNRDDDRQCGDDKANGKWSLSCALDTACIEVLGEYDHTNVALQEVRFAVEEATPDKQLNGRLMGFNNLPETRFEDIKRMLRIARERLVARQKRQAQP
ncbi:MAG: hypothetical protein ABIR28_08440 [Vicinamibacteria bacterium]